LLVFFGMTARIQYMCESPTNVKMEAAGSAKGSRQNLKKGKKEKEVGE
jgi:hypothetical protein